MIDLNKVQFMTTPEGIRGAKVFEYNEITAQMCAVIYIHRYDIGVILGLYRTDENRVEWSRLLNAFNEVEMLIKEPGFSTLENKTSSKTIPSKYEIQIPEYIRKEIIYLMAMRLDNPQAISYQSDLATKVIPFFEQHASIEQIQDTPIIKNLYQFNENVVLNSTVATNRRDMINFSINKIERYCYTKNYDSDRNKILKDLVSILDQESLNTINLPLISVVFGMKVNTGIPMNISSDKFNAEDVIDCACYSTDFFNKVISTLNNIFANYERDIVNRDNKNNIEGGGIPNCIRITKEDNSECFVYLTGDLNNYIKYFNGKIKEEDIWRYINGYGTLEGIKSFSIIDTKDIITKQPVNFIPTADIYKFPESLK